MRVLHLISSGGMYGAEAVILNLARGLQAAGHELVLGAFVNSAAPNLQLYERAVAEGVPSHRIECRGQFDRSVPRALRELLHQTGAEVVHAHGYKADVYAALALRGRVPLLSTCHTWYDNDLAVRLYGALDRLALRWFTRVVAVSDEVRQRLLAAGVRPERVSLVRNGVDLRPFAGDRPRREQQLRVGLVGRLAPEKGVDLFLRAAAIVAEQLPNATFVVAGEGPERPALERLRQELKLDGRVDLPGQITDMPAFYRSLDLLVSASRQEGLPVAMLEGLASALPVVATAVGEVPTLVRDGDTGRLVAPENVSALSAAMLDLLREPARCVALGERGRAVIAAEYSVERMTDDYLRLYQAVRGQA